MQGLNQTGTDLEAVAKFLDASGAKLDYRRYAETLFDILVAGGMLGELQAFLLNFALYNGNKMSSALWVFRLILACTSVPPCFCIDVDTVISRGETCDAPTT